MKLTKITLITLLLSIVTAGNLVAAPHTIHAANTPKDAACEGIALTGGSCDPLMDPSDPNSPETKVNSTIGMVVNIFSIAVGITAVIMIIIGGFKYVISQGDSNNINSAKNTILYALIGLVVVALSQIIVRYVLRQI